MLHWIISAAFTGAAASAGAAAAWMTMLSSDTRSARLTRMRTAYSGVLAIAATDFSFLAWLYS
jgi:hypothetical protein